MSPPSRRLIGSAAVVLLGGSIVFAAAPVRADEANCEVPPELLQVEVKLPHLGERIRAHQPVTIVAIGGASTIGAAAGSADLAYPHRLQVALASAYPDVSVNVVNKGVPRQSAHQMLERFATDVFAEDPVLVIWETGITDAVRGIEIDDFAGAVQDGIDELKNRSVDTLLVDMQFSRKTIALIDFDKYLSTLHHLGEINDVYVFPRFEVMRYWSEQNTFNFDEVTPSERADLAARVYDCLGRKLAGAIKRALR